MSPRILVVLVIACLVGAVGAAAQQGPRIDPLAEHLLRGASRYLASLEHFSFEAAVLEDEWTDAGLLVELDRSVKLAVRRPDGMWADAQSSGGHKRYWYDSGTFTLMDYGPGTYARATVPSDIDGMLATMVERYGVTTPLADLALSDLYEAVSENLVSGTYVGMRTIDGVEHHHLAFSQESIDWQLWIADGLRPLPSKMIITYKNEAGSPRFSAVLSAWDTVGPIPDARFDFVPPPGATEIDFVAVGDGGR